MSGQINVCCAVCSKNVKRNIKCDVCAKFFHVKCAKISTKDFVLSTNWSCFECRRGVFPLIDVTDEEFASAFSEKPSNRIPLKNTKCGGCAKRIKKNREGIYASCHTCFNFFHKQCAKDHSNYIHWQCNQCSLAALPFANSSDNEYLLNIFGFNDKTSDFLKNVTSFSIQTLMDQLPGDHFDTNEFLSDSITSKYYTPAEFLREKFPKNKFSIIHLNIASIAAHIDELRTLLAVLEHPFDVICLTETKIQEDKPLINCKIEGYDFFHEKTTTQCGGAAIYVKTHYDPTKVNKFSVSIPKIVEAVFVEICSPSKKKLLIGSIYRHPSSTVDDFIKEFLHNTLIDITIKNKICILAGDFNIDLIKFGQVTCVDTFYDLITTHGFRPLILNPTRITHRSATLIDNFFINDLSCVSNGGNLTHSISDHFLQFTQLDIFEYFNENVTHIKYARNWRIFNKNEFKEELSRVNWNDVHDPRMNTNQKFKNFYDKLDKLLDEMAPVKKLSKKEQGLSQRPWISHGILTSMNKRDQIYRDLSNEKDLLKKEELTVLYKRYRNEVVNLIRISKKDYFSNYFEQHRANMKKTWEGIRNIINVTKKASLKINKLLNQGNVISDDHGMANAMNNFFVNIGSTVEEKIPKVNKSFNSYLGDINGSEIVIEDVTILPSTDKFR